MQPVFLKDELDGRVAMRALVALCPAIALTATMQNALWLAALAALAVLGAAICASLLRPLTSDHLRMPIFLVVCAAFSALGQLLLAAWRPDAAKALGAPAPAVMAAAALLMYQADGPGVRFGASVRSALIGAIAYAALTLALGAAREALGKGALFGASIGGFQPAGMFALVSGGLIAAGVLAGAVQAFARRATREEEQP
ncbi:MAG: hypothetical protein GX558_01825 [Clostridiales bacterium]|nr:hypothetical protein [Clostridiales bacterium]